MNIPETAKAAPPVAVSVAGYLNVTMSDIVLIVTLIYTVILILTKLPKALQSLQVIWSWLRGKGKLVPPPDTENGD